MKNETVPFINNLSASAAVQGSTSHSHEHGGATHEHGGPGGEHGHTHEHLEHAGEFNHSGHLEYTKLSYSMLNGLFMFIVGKFAEREMPDYSGRNFEERGFTVGIGGCISK